MAEEDCAYEVDTIQGRRIRQGHIEYLIRWKNFDSNWDSWEPVTSLGDAFDAIEEYNRHNLLLTLSPYIKSSPKKSKELSKKQDKKVVTVKPKMVKKLDMGSKDQKQKSNRKETSVKKKTYKSTGAKKQKLNDSKNGNSKKKTKSSATDESCDSDDGIRYSLNTEYVWPEVDRQSAQKEVKTSDKKYRMTLSERRKKMAAPRTLRSGKTVSTKPVKLNIKPRKRSLSGAVIDEEISFQPLDSPKRYRFSNFHLPTTIVRPVARTPNMTLTREMMPSPLRGPTPFKTPPSSPRPTTPLSLTPRLTRSRSLTPSKDLFSTLSPRMFSVVPASPSTVSYQALIQDLPHKLQANRHQKRRQSNERRTESSEEDEDDDAVGRRLSVRQSELSFKYKEIVVKKFKGYTQIWLFTNTQMRNALNPSVFQELTSALNNAKFDDSKLVMLSGSGNTFCSGIDLNFLTSGDVKVTAKKVAASLREFMNAIISFPKPVVAAINGPAIGLGVGILPLCDIVYASDKASFYMPYARLGQTPEGCASLTLGQTVGQAMAAEMLLGGRKLTAIEAYQVGLVSQVFWPTSMMQEVIPRVCNMASFSAKALEATKLLIRSHQKSKLEFTNESECSLLVDTWATSDCQKAIQNYLEDENDILF